MPTPPPALASVAAVWRAVATTVVPEATELDPAAWQEIDAIVGRALAARPPYVRRQITLFLRLLDWLPLVRYGRRFTALGPARRARICTMLQQAAPRLLRRSFLGVRTLVFLGYYGRPRAGAAIGYRADARGWEARR